MSYNIELQNINTDLQEILNRINLLPDNNDKLNALLNKSIIEYNDNIVTSIGYRAFYNCTSLTTIDLPNVTSIGIGAFYECTSLTNIDLPKATFIQNNAFENCTSLTTIDLPNVTSIGNWAFDNCTSLTTIDLPNVTSIGDDAFHYCESLTTIDLPNVTSIDYGAFSNCTSLSSIDLPKVTEIDRTAFINCISLSTLILRSNTLCDLLDTGAFSNTPIKNGTGYIYVPKALIEDYKVDTNWSTYESQFRAIEDYPEICGVTFTINNTPVTVPAGTTWNDLLGTTVEGYEITADENSLVYVNNYSKYITYDSYPINIYSEIVNNRSYYISNIAM